MWVHSGDPGAHSAWIGEGVWRAPGGLPFSSGELQRGVVRSSSQCRMGGVCTPRKKKSIKWTGEGRGAGPHGGGWRRQAEKLVHPASLLGAGLFPGGQRGHQAEAQHGVVPDHHQGSLGPGTLQHPWLLWTKDCARPPLAAEALGCTEWGGGEAGEQRQGQVGLSRGQGQRVLLTIHPLRSQLPTVCLSTYLPGSPPHICVCR